MDIKKAAMAGTLESSDCMVTVEPGGGRVECAVYRSCDIKENLPWGGAVR